MKEFYVICFDVRDERRLARISNTLENFGTRVQRSLFECYLEEYELRRLKEKLAALGDFTEDQVRYYSICPKDKARMLIDGKGEVTRDPDFLMY